METAALFYESMEEAQRDDVRALGGLKVVGALFFPEKDVEAAARALADKINAGRRERLTDEQERLLMRMAREKRGFSATLAYLCDDTGFDRPKPIAPADKAAQLMREFNRSVESLGRIQKELAGMGVMPAIRAVS